MSFPLGHRGFTLLEVIVALVLIATAGMAVFSWINSSLAGLNRVQEKTKLQEVNRSAMSYMQTVNPMIRPSGVAEMGVYEIHWQSSLVEPPRMGSGQLGGTSLYELALYDTHVQILLEGKDVTAFELRLVGFRQIRQFNFGF
jgi:general secretion pathway protein I